MGTRFRMRWWMFVLGLALALAGGAVAAPLIGVSGTLDGFAEALAERRVSAEAAETKPERRLARVLGRIEKKLLREKTSRSLAEEILAAKSAAAILAKPLGAEAGLVPLLDDAADRYATDLASGRDAFAAANDLGAPKSIPPAKLLTKIDASLAKANAATKLKQRLAALAKVAKLLPPAGNGGGPTPTGRGSPIAAVVDSTGSYLYVAERGGIEVGDVGGVRQMSFTAGGVLTDLSPPRVDAGTTPIAIAAHPSAGFVYVGNLTSNSVSQFAIGAGGRLTPLSPPSIALATGDRPAFLTVVPEGDLLIVASPSILPSGTAVATYPIATDGTLGAEVSVSYAPPMPSGLAVTGLDPALNARHALVATTYRTGSSSIDPGIRKFQVSLGGTVEFQAWVNAEVGAISLNSSGGYVHAAVTVFDQGPKRGIATFALLPSAPFLTQVEQPIVLGPKVSGIDSILRVRGAPWIYFGDGGAQVIHSFSAGLDGRVSVLNATTHPAPGVVSLTDDPAGTLLFAINANGSGAAPNIVTVYRIGAVGELSVP